MTTSGEDFGRGLRAVPEFISLIQLFYTDTHSGNPLARRFSSAAAGPTPALALKPPLPPSARPKRRRRSRPQPLPSPSPPTPQEDGGAALAARSRPTAAPPPAMARPLSGAARGGRQRAEASTRTPPPHPLLSRETASGNRAQFEAGRAGVAAVAGARRLAGDRLWWRPRGWGRLGCGAGASVRLRPFRR